MINNNVTDFEVWEKRVAFQKCFVIGCSFTLVILWFVKYFAWDSGLSMVHFNKQPSLQLERVGLLLL